MSNSDKDNQAVRSNSQDAEAYFLQGLKRNYVIDGQKAIKDFSQAIQINPNYAEAYYERGFIYFGENKHQKAIKDFTQVIRINPNYAEAYYWRGYISFKQENQQAAFNDFEQVIKLRSDIAEAWFVRAFIRDSFGEQQGATEDYVQAIHAWSLVQNDPIKKFKYERMIHDSDQIIQANPELAYFYYPGLAFLVVKEARSSEETDSFSIFPNDEFSFVDEDDQKVLVNFRQVIKLKPEFAEVYYYMYWVNGDSKYCRQAIQLKPDFFEAYFELGQIYEKEGERSKAVDNYSKAIQINPNFALAYFYRALIYTELQDEQRALNDFIQVLKLSPEIIREYLDTNTIYSPYYHEQAAEGYIQILQTKPQNANDYCQRGSVRGKLGDVQGALKDLNKSIQLNSEFAEAYFERAHIRFIKSDEGDEGRKILSDYDKAIRLNPNFADAYCNRGVIRLLDGQLLLANVNRGIEDLNQAIRLNPNQAEAYFARSVSYFIQFEAEIYQLTGEFPGEEHEPEKRKRLPNLLNDVLKAVRLDPEVTKDHSDVIEPSNRFILVELGDKPRIVEKFHRIIQSDSVNSDAYYNRGWAYLKVGDQQGAVQDFTWVIQHNPQDAKAYYGRGFAYYRLKNYQQAIEDYSQAIELDPSFVEAYFLRSLVRYDSGDKQGAMEDANQAIRCSYGEYINAYLVRSQIRYDFGDNLGAWEDFLAGAAGAYFPGIGKAAARGRPRSR